MNEQTYITVGISILTFLIGLKLKKKLSKSKTSETQHVGKLYGKKYKQKKTLSEILDSKKNINNKRKKKWRNIFIKTIVFLMFLFILFIIPGIIRSIMISNDIFDENIILRLVILILALLSLIAGVIKIMSPAKK